jgi:PilZ domain
MIGEYSNITSGKSGPMTIEDLSMEGIGFYDTRTEVFNIGDIVVLTFELDDFDKSRIRAKVAVRQKWGNVVGCEIIEIMEGGADFGLYLLP